MPILNADLMRQAREVLKGKWGVAVLGNFLFLLVTSVIQLVPLLGTLAYLIIAGPLLFGLVLFFLKLGRGQEVRGSEIFDGFQRFGDALITFILWILFIVLWSLLLFIPGILAGFSYALTFFLMADQPDLKGRAALRESRKLMKGHRWKLFCLFCRFIGWYLLGILSLGIGFLWIIPYLWTSMARFYDDIRYGEGALESIEVEAKPMTHPSTSPKTPQQAKSPEPAKSTPPVQPMPVSEPPKASGDPLARVCLKCHGIINDPKAQKCPECGYLIVGIQGTSGKIEPPASSSPSSQPRPKTVPPISPLPQQPMDLEATIQIRPSRLTSLSPEGREEVFELRRPVIKIGRQPDNDLAIPTERTISGRHCEIYQKGKDYFIKDLGSSNGILINGQKVEEARLEEGDEVKLGNKIFHFSQR
jgi:uncharacterized membrane protein